MQYNYNIIVIVTCLITFSALEVEGSFQLREDGAIFCLKPWVVRCSAETWSIIYKLDSSYSSVFKYWECLEVEMKLGRRWLSRFLHLEDIDLKTRTFRSITSILSSVLCDTLLWVFFWNCSLPFSLFQVLSFQHQGTRTSHVLKTLEIMALENSKRKPWNFSCSSCELCRGSWKACFATSTSIVFEKGKVSLKDDNPSRKWYVS